MPSTSSPTWKRVTPTPTSVTVPATSQPIVIGGSTIPAIPFPARVLKSTGLIPAAWTRTWTSVAIGLGAGTSSSSSTSGPPKEGWTIALTGRSYGPHPDSKHGRVSLVYSSTHAPRQRLLVVEAHQRDHVADVVLALDPPRRWALAIGKDRVVDDSPFVVELAPGLAREEEVGGVVAVQVADLAAAELEGELTAAAGPSGDAVPGGDLGRDCLAWSDGFA